MALRRHQSKLSVHSVVHLASARESIEHHKPALAEPAGAASAAAPSSASSEVGNFVIPTMSFQEFEQDSQDYRNLQQDQKWTGRASAGVKLAGRQQSRCPCPQPVSKAHWKPLLKSSLLCPMAVPNCDVFYSPEVFASIDLLSVCDVFLCWFHCQRVISASIVFAVCSLHQGQIYAREMPCRTR